MILESIRHNLGGLLSFSGRSSREQFWPYTGLLFAICFAALMLTSVAGLADAMRRMALFAAEHPPEAAHNLGPGYTVTVTAMPADVLPDLNAFLLLVAAISFLFILLVAAAVTRRLHDRDISAWWALLPVLLLASGLFLFGWLAARLGAPEGMVPGDPFLAILLLSANNLTYLVALALLGWLLSQAGTPGPNRFGDPEA